MVLVCFDGFDGLSTTMTSPAQRYQEVKPRGPFGDMGEIRHDKK
jgi:hypothetical protein